MSSHRRFDGSGFWQAIGRPVLAYCLASYAAGLIIYLSILSIDRDPSIDFAKFLAYSTLFAVSVAVLALIPTILAVLALRKTRLRRGFTEVGVGALIGIFVSSVLYTAIGDDTIAIWTFLSRAALFGVAGAVAGLTYWLANGRPQSQKRHDGRAQFGGSTSSD